VAHLRIIAVSLLLATLWLGQVAVRAQRNDVFRVIVHPQNPVTSVERAFLRDAFLKKATNWPHGNAIRPIDLANKLPVREQFILDVLKKTPAQLRSYWTQRIFSGLDVPPPEADSAEAAVRYVLGNSGAVAYLPEGTDPKGAKVITLVR